MEIHLYQYIIICPLVFLAGFVDAVAGGGGLISLPAYLIAGLPVHNAIGTNKLSSSMGTTVATAKYALRGFIPWRQAAFCVVFALLGSNMGARLALRIDDRYFKMIMLVILPLTAVYVMSGMGVGAEREPLSPVKTVLLSMAISLCAGVYDGFYGPGTGTFLILLLTGLAHMGLGEANGTAKAINLTTNVTALYVYWTNGVVITALGAAAGIFSIAGNYLGARCFEKGGAKSVKPIMAAVLVVFFIKVSLELLGVI